MYILVVDDERSIVKMIGRQLQKAGYGSVCLDDPEQAIKFFMGNYRALDLAILDVHMPGMTGIKMAEKIFEIEPTFPVILITSALNGIEIETDNNVKSVLKKPIPREELLDTVRKSLYC